MQSNGEELVVIPLRQLTEIIKTSVDSTMEKWLDKKIQQEHEDKKKEETMLTINEVVAKYKVSRSTLYHKTKSGDLPCHRLGARVLICKADIEKVIKDGGLSKN